MFIICISEIFFLFCLKILNYSQTGYPTNMIYSFSGAQETKFGNWEEKFIRKSSVLGIKAIVRQPWRRFALVT